MHLILIGLRGSGKSAVARRLANLLWKTAADSDKLALAHFEEADSITQVWENHGEHAWRAVEAELCAQLNTDDGIPAGNWPQETDLIIALGGGVPMVPDAATALAQLRQAKQARILYLACRPEVLCARLQSQVAGLLDESRPPLTDADNLLDEIRQVATERDPVYRDLADGVVDVSDLTVDQVSNHIVKSYM
ncbi:MAG: shikimate kinase [Planctomycetes bacterium]|nr:shikimate kinase [Planctomycetota bacterium]